MPESHDRYFVIPVAPSTDMAHEICKQATDRSRQGMHLIEACGNENRQPALIFERGEYRDIEYLVEVIPSAKNQDDLTTMTRVLNKFNSLGWKLITVLDRPLARPVVKAAAAAQPAAGCSPSQIAHTYWLEYLHEPERRSLSDMKYDALRNTEVNDTLSLEALQSVIGGMDFAGLPRGINSVCWEAGMVEGKASLPRAQIT